MYIGIGWKAMPVLYARLSCPRATPEPCHVRAGAKRPFRAGAPHPETLRRGFTHTGEAQGCRRTTASVAGGRSLATSRRVSDLRSARSPSRGNPRAQPCLPRAPQRLQVQRSGVAAPGGVAAAAPGGDGAAVPGGGGAGELLEVWYSEAGDYYDDEAAAAAAEELLRGRPGDELSIQDLLRKFHSLKVSMGLPAGEGGEGEEVMDLRLKLLRTRIPGLPVKRVEVAPSTVPGGGNGVFATRDIQEGELVTLYPGDALLRYPAAWGSGGRATPAEPGASQGKVQRILGNHMTDEEVVSDLIEMAKEYQLQAASLAQVSLCGAPRLREDPAYVGHIVNDGAMCAGTSEAHQEEYNRATEAAANAVYRGLEGCHMALLALRDIRRGEEVFVTYTASYWVGRIESP